MGRVTLAFDNGPHEEITPGVLAVLARHNVKASFFVIGEKPTEA
jgi:peptidoglycan/xylan/chitin deacetylase (PgdA/CDA1 family)